MTKYAENAAVIYTVNNQKMPRIKNSYLYLGGCLLLGLSAVLRYISYPIVSGDYTSSLSHWIDALRGSPGLTAFAHPFSDYPPLYLYLLKWAAVLPGPDLYWIKTFSLVFDVILAIAIVLIVARARTVAGRPYSAAQIFFCFSIVLVIPTVLVNSSLWAQSDSIYAAFVLFSLYFILSDKPLLAVLAFALAFGLKLQSIFFLPVILGYLLVKKGGWAYLLIVPAVFIATLIPAALAGGSFGQLFYTYLNQAGEFQQLNLSSPSIFSFFGDSQLPSLVATVLSYGGTAIALVVAGMVVVLVMRHFNSRSNSSESLIFIALVSVLTIPFFLPHMHDRYFYLADCVSVLYALFEPRRWHIPLVVVGASFFSYMPFLSGSVPLFGRLLFPLGVFGVILLILQVSFVHRFRALAL